jgi:release factor glutamine methyltransferase
MNRREALTRACGLLTASHVGDAAFEADLLLRYTLSLDRATLLAGLDEPMSAGDESAYEYNVQRRARGQPTAYITGVREFYGLEFCVDDGVLIPRPETELLVERALEQAGQHAAPVIADIGTGCGAIAVSLAVKVPPASLIATDISQRALTTARCNCERHQVVNRVKLHLGDLLEPLTQPVDILVANLPYVRTVDLRHVNTDGWEPRLALDGGMDGLDVIRRFCLNVPGLVKPGGSLMLEIGVGQAAAVVDLLEPGFPSASIRVYPDLGGIDRVVCLTLSA